LSRISRISREPWLRIADRIGGLFLERAESSKRLRESKAEPKVHPFDGPWVIFERNAVHQKGDIPLMPDSKPKRLPSKL
jgi:hypothetical protein